MKWCMATGKVNQSGFHGKVKISICVIIPSKCGFYVKWFVVVNWVIDQEIPWSCLSDICTVLTVFVVNIEIARTVPVCCITGDYDVSFIAVEHKNLRNRHKLFVLIYFKHDETLHNLFISRKLIYRFCLISPTIIRSTHTIIYRIWYLTNRYCYLPLLWKSWNCFECEVGIILICFAVDATTLMMGEDTTPKM